jgi:excisionase family DNA binding protein
MAQEPEEYITTQEAARLLGVGRVTFWRRVKAGLVPTYRSQKDQRVRLIKRSDVEAMLVPEIVSGETVRGKGKQSNA